MFSAAILMHSQQGIVCLTNQKGEILATKARQLFLYMVYSETVSLTVFTCLNITGLTK